MTESVNIAIAGTGKATRTILPHLSEESFICTHIWGRSKVSTRELCDEFNAEEIKDPKSFNNADVLILAVSDDYISKISSRFKAFDGVVIHLSGTRPISDIKCKNKAVAWPIQSLLGESTILEGVPFCYEANNNNEQVVENIIKHLGGRPVRCGVTRRKQLHLAAVFANNYTNFLLTNAENILGNHEALTLLLPMMKESIARWEKQSPSKTQTGPAIRRDHKTIDKHLLMLRDNEQARAIYKLFSELIESYHNDDL